MSVLTLVSWSLTGEVKDKTSLQIGCFIIGYESRVSETCCFKRFYCMPFLKKSIYGKEEKAKLFFKMVEMILFNDTFFHLFVLFHLSVSSVVLLNYDTEPHKMLILHVFQVMQLNVENVSEEQILYTYSDSFRESFDHKVIFPL